MLKEDLNPANGEQSLFNHEKQELKVVSGCKEYVYTLLVRPFGMDTQPEYGFIRHQTSGTVFGQVVFDHLLTPQQCRKYCLRPDTGLQQLQGNTYCILSKEPGQKHILNIDNYNSDTGVFEITYNKNTPNEKHSYTTWKHVVTQLSTGQWNLQTKLHNQ